MADATPVRRLGIMLGWDAVAAQVLTSFMGWKIGRELMIR